MRLLLLLLARAADWGPLRITVKSQNTTFRQSILQSDCEGFEEYTRVLQVDDAGSDSDLDVDSDAGSSADADGAGGRLVEVDAESLLQDGAGEYPSWLRTKAVLAHLLAACRARAALLPGGAAALAAAAAGRASSAGVPPACKAAGDPAAAMRAALAAQ